MVQTLEYQKRGHGPIIVILPGAGNIEPNSYKQLTDQLEKFYTVYTLFYPGFNNTPKFSKENLSKGTFLASVNKTIEKISNGNKIILFGHSIGAGLAIEFTARYPEIEKQLILISPQYKPIGIDTGLLLFKGFLSARKSNRRLKDKGINATNAYSSRVIKSIPGFLSLRKIARQVTPLKIVHEVNIPTLAFVGMHDVLLNPSRQLELLTQIPNCKIVRYSDEGHYSMQHKPSEVSKAITEFIKNNEN